MPVSPPCAHLDPGQAKVKVLRDSRNRSTLWIDSKSLPWLICYIIDEVAFGGVDALTIDPQPPREPNCEVPGLYTEWDFQHGANGAWTARFVSGPLEGRIVTSTPESMNETKWTAVAGDAGQSFDDASYSERKDATLRYLVQVCAQMLRGHSSAPVSYTHLTLPTNREV